MPLGYFKKKELRERMMSRILDDIEIEHYSLQQGSTYHNNQTHMIFICPRGHEWRATWNGWTNGKRCRHCWIEDSRVSQEEVARRMAEHGCELLGEYKRVDQPVKYRCSCGKVAYIRMHDFYDGVRCSRCAGDRARESLRKKRTERLASFDEVAASHDSIRS